MDFFLCSRTSYIVRKDHVTSSPCPLYFFSSFFFFTCLIITLLNSFCIWKCLLWYLFQMPLSVALSGLIFLMWCLWYVSKTNPLVTSDVFCLLSRCARTLRGVACSSPSRTPARRRWSWVWPLLRCMGASRASHCTTPTGSRPPKAA